MIKRFNFNTLVNMKGGEQVLEQEAATQERVLDCKSELGFTIMKLGNNFMVARRAINDSCKYFLDLPNTMTDTFLQEKEQLKEEMAKADIVLERLQGNYLRLLQAIEGSNGKSRIMD